MAAYMLIALIVAIICHTAAAPHCMNAWSPQQRRVSMAGVTSGVCVRGSGEWMGSGVQGSKGERGAQQ